MHSRRADPARALARTALVTACSVCLAGGLRAQEASQAVDAPAAASAPAGLASSVAANPRAARVETAVGQLRDDPLLAGKHKEHRLRWKDPDAPPPRKHASPAWLAWIASFARFLNDTSRVLLWGLVAVVVTLGLISARHLVQLRAWHLRAKAESAVSHVRDLDVRPESLPDDVGAAAWALWQAGQVPSALSLLYRGALSRLIHKFKVPITSSATEGECLELARGRLEPGALRYVTQVVRAWEANIYGGRVLSMAMGEALCSGFGGRLDARLSATSEDAR